MKRILLTVLLILCLAAAFLVPRMALSAGAEAIKDTVSTAQPLTSSQDGEVSVMDHLMLLADTNTQKISMGELESDQAVVLDAFSAEVETLYELGAITGSMLACFVPEELGAIERWFCLNMITGESSQVYIVYAQYGDYGMYDPVSGKILALSWTHDSELMYWETKNLRDVSIEENYQKQLSAWAEYYGLESGGDQLLNDNVDLSNVYSYNGEDTECLMAGSMTDGETTVGMMLSVQYFVDGLAWSPVSMDALSVATDAAESP